MERLVDIRQKSRDMDCPFCNDGWGVELPKNLHYQCYN